MIRKLLTLITFAVIICNRMMADNTFAIENLSGAQGGQVVLPILMNNSDEITAFSFELYLPEGVTVAKNVSDDFVVENTSRADDQAISTNMYEGVFYIATLSPKSKAYTGNEGAVCNVTLDIAEDASLDNKTIEIKNIVLATKNTKKIMPQDLSCVLTVVDASSLYNYDYSFSITPFSVAKSTNYTINLNFNAKDENITDLELDMELPSFLSRTKNGRVTKSFDSADENRMYISGTDGDHSVTVDGNHVTISSVATDEYKYIAGTSGALLNMYYTSGASIDAGIYPINLTNIKATNGDGVVLSLAPVTSYVKVGNPTNASLSLSGLVTSDVNDALAEETAITSLDMSNVTAIDGTLSLVDRRSYVAPKRAVDVEKVEYVRSMSNSFGTVCVPFDIASDETIQLYQLKNVTDNTMTFEPVANVSAGTPTVFKLLSGSQADFAAENATISAGEESCDCTIDGESWTMNGTYANMNLDPAACSNDIYYISENKFVYGNIAFDVATYRAWFETPKSAAGTKVFNIEIDDAEATGVKYVEKADGTVDVVFDLSGNKLPSAKNGINIINGKKVFVK